MPEGGRSIKKRILSIISKKIPFFFKKKDTNVISNEIIDESITKDINDSLLEYQALKAEDVMIPRVDIVALDYNSSLEEISEVFTKTRYTRIPVYKNKLDDIVGFINIKDIFPFLLKEKDNKEFKISKVMHKLLIISPSMKVFNLLDKMKQTRTHMALVVDELGGADGLVTIDDLIEEIIGDIDDEHDQVNKNLYCKKINSKTFEASGRIEIEDLEEKLGVQLRSQEAEEEYDTLGGLILSISSSVPNKGDKIVHPLSNIVFEVIESDPRRIKKVLIKLP